MKAVITGLDKFDSITLIPETEQEEMDLQRITNGEFLAYKRTTLMVHDFSIIFENRRA